MVNVFVLCNSSYPIKWDRRFGGRRWSARTSDEVRKVTNCKWECRPKRWLSYSARYKSWWRYTKNWKSETDTWERRHGEFIVCGPETVTFSAVNEILRLFIVARNALNTKADPAAVSTDSPSPNAHVRRIYRRIPVFYDLIWIKNCTTVSRDVLEGDYWVHLTSWDGNCAPCHHRSINFRQVSSRRMIHSHDSTQIASSSWAWPFVLPSPNMSQDSARPNYAFNVGSCLAFKTVCFPFQSEKLRLSLDLCTIALITPTRWVSGAPWITGRY